MKYRSRDKACCRLVVLMTVLLALVTGCEWYGDMLSQPRATLQSEIWSIRVAPDGRKVVLQARLHEAGEYIGADEMIFLDIDTGEVLYRYGPCLDLRPWQWSADGSEILFYRSHGSQDTYLETTGVFVLDLSSKETWRGVPEVMHQRRAMWSPDYDEIVFGGARVDLTTDMLQEPPSIYAIRLHDEDLRRIAVDARLKAVAPRREDGDYWIFFSRSKPVEGVELDWTYSFWVTSARNGNEREIVPHAWDVREASVSPDGTQLALLTNYHDESKGQLAIYPWTIDGEKTRIDIPDSLMRALWSPDGETVLCTGRREVWIYELQTDNLQSISVEAVEGSVHPACVAWLPNSEEFLVGRGPTLWLFDAKSGKGQVVYKVEGQAEVADRAGYLHDHGLHLP